MPDLRIRRIIDQMTAENFDAGFYTLLAGLLADLLLKGDVQGVLHPLGFVIVTLQDWQHDQRLRLHLWPESGRIYNNNQLWIHNHQYAVTSLVLLGSLTNTNYRIDTRAASPGYVIYEVLYYDSNSDLVDHGSACNVLFKGERTYQTGEHYLLKRGDFHIADTEADRVSCSLVLNSDPGKEPALVLGAADDARPEFIFSRGQFDQERLRDLLSDLIPKVLALATG